MTSEERWEQQRKLNILHADNPKEGDYWDEMFSPILRVLMVNDNWVLVQHLSGMGGQEITEYDPIPTIMIREEFAKYVRYDSMPDKTWCDVVPEKFK